MYVYIYINVMHLIMYCSVCMLCYVYIYIYISANRIKMQDDSLESYCIKMHAKADQSSDHSIEIPSASGKHLHRGRPGG